MNNYPEYAEINGKRYKINTDFRVAIRCNQIAEDPTIGDLERALGIIETLFGDQAIDDGKEDAELYNKLLKVAKKYLLCGEEAIDNTEKPDMDYIQDEKYIKSSFKYDYQYDPYSMECLHWWEFFNDLNNLSNSEVGNCCILSRVRNLRNFDLKDIKDPKERQKIIKAKQQVALRKKEVKLTEKQQQSVENLMRDLGIRKE